MKKASPKKLEQPSQKVPIARSAPAQASPYVIRLSRGSGDVGATPQVPEEFIFDIEEDDAAPVVNDARYQLAEHDIVLDLPEVEEAPQSEEREEITFDEGAPVAVTSRRDIITSIFEGQETGDGGQGTTPEPVRRMPVRWHRAVATITVAAFILVMPLHLLQSVQATKAEADDIAALGKEALDDLSFGATAFTDQRFAVATDQFSAAAARFASAEAELESMHAAIAAVVNVIPQTDRTYDSVAGLITAGRELSTVAGLMSRAAEDIAPATSIDIVTKLNLLSTAVAEAAPHAAGAAKAVEDVDPAVVPVEYADTVLALKAYVPQLAAVCNEFITFSNTLATMLGGEGAMRYLVAFQNPTELRPTGGFIGSFAEVDVRHGEIENLLVPGGGTYDVQGQLTKFVAAPSPLGLINPRWELQDANWFPDFATSARKVQWFYENAGGPTTDGVLALNANVVVQLLALTGPVEMPEYGRTITAENFMFEAQKIVELEYDKAENKPKAFIGDLAPVLLKRVTEADFPTFLAVLDLIGRSLEERDIQLYFRKAELQVAVEDLGWSGTLKHPSGDYLMVVNTNLGGGKTDAVIDQNVDVDVRIGDDGSVTNTVTITKTHRGLANALFSGRNNVDYLRLYVPEGSVLVSADGFEPPSPTLFEASDVPLSPDEDLALAMADIAVDTTTGVATWREEGKTVFGNWMQTAPGETEVVTFTYRLPFAIGPAENGGLLAKAKQSLGAPQLAPYTLYVQKQSGADTRLTNVHITWPAMLTPVWQSDDRLGVETVEQTNATDGYYRILFEQV